MLQHSMVRCYESRTSWMVSGGGTGAGSSCSDLTDRSSTICFCLPPHSPNYQGIQRGGLENLKNLIQSITSFVFCWVSNDYAISCIGTDRAPHWAGLINRHREHLILKRQRRQTRQWDLDGEQQIYKLWHRWSSTVIQQTFSVRNKCHLYLSIYTRVGDLVTITADIIKAPRL